MALLFIPANFNTEIWLEALHSVDQALDIRMWPNVGNVEDIDFALVWRYPPGELQKYPNLKCISSLGAGVDHILSDQHLPKNVPIVRVIDKILMRDMTQYVVMAVLNYTRQFESYCQQQIQKQWILHQPTNELMIGVMGLGQLGTDAAKKLTQLKFNVQGWSRTHKKIRGLKTFCGKNELDTFLSQSHVLINLLPLTQETKNIFNQALFSQVPKGAYIINVARGQHVVDADLIEALNHGKLNGACLDVFREEPLPPSHPFWDHPKIRITPHIASVTNPKSVAKQIIQNYRNALAGKPLLHLVNAERGY